MATRLLKFKTDEGEVLIAAQAPDSIVKATGKLEDTIEEVQRSLDSALRIVSGVSASFSKVFSELTADTADLELGLQFTAKGSVYVVETTGEASLKIKLSFKRAT